MQPSTTGVGGSCEVTSAAAAIDLGICRALVFMNASEKDDKSLGLISSW
jgi:hypothetical protein